MKHSRTLNIGILVTAIIFTFLGCDSMTPTEGNSQATLDQQGVQFDQLNLVEWSPEVVSALRFVQTADEENIMARIADLDGCEVGLVTSSWGGTVGGSMTFGNSVTFPAGAMDHDKYIAVQVVCADADELATFENGVQYINMIKSEFIELSYNLANGGDDENDYYNQLASNYVLEALDAVEQAEVYFELYTFFASHHAFRKLESKVLQIVRNLLFYAEAGYINEDIYPSLLSIAMLSTEACRDLALTSIEYAESIPEANSNKISQAWAKIEAGDNYVNTVHPAFDHEWFRFRAGLLKYFQAWNKATLALNNIESPCGASVDFLPSQEFNADIYVTLSWEALNFDGDADELEIFWYNESTNLWVLVPNPVINYDEGTVSVWIDHFTRYAWTVRPPPSGD